ncbi:hypothetical protein [Streptomyces sp. NPDC048277]|uniref:hypothetical protein n=1 Tax=Streptomyces sp. NPDC048277 TaxID=3155027 RepID=UPI0033E9BDC2
MHPLPTAQQAERGEMVTVSARALELRSPHEVPHIEPWGPHAVRVRGTPTSGASRAAIRMTPRTGRC